MNDIAIKMDLSDKTDEQLVALTLQNPDIYLFLMRRYEQKLLRYIRGMSGMSQEDAEDVLQEIFIKTYRNLNDFDRDLKFSAWLYRIAHNEAINHYRRLKARPATSSIEDNRMEFLQHLYSDFNADQKVDKKLLAKAVDEILTAMDEKYREVLVLKYLEDRNYREISDILEKSIGTVATLINRAKKQFKTEAGKQGINLNISLYV